MHRAGRAERLRVSPAAYRGCVPETPQAPSTGPAAGPPAPPADRRPHRSGWPRTIVEFCVAITVIALIQGFAIKAYQIPSASMEQTLEVGDRILVNRLDNTVERGDIVVFEHGDTWAAARKSPSDRALVNVARLVGSVIGIGPSTKAYTVKRVVGIGGEKVACCDADGRVTVDGVALNEDYLGSNLPFEPGAQDCTGDARSVRCFPEITVPAGSLLVLGDNRANSSDSVVGCRAQNQADDCARFVREDRVVGPVVGRFWPPSAIGGVSP